MNHQESTAPSSINHMDIDVNDINIPYRLTLVSLTQERIAYLTPYLSIIKNAIDGIVDTFYIHQLSIDAIASIIDTPLVLNKLKRLQKDYVTSLFKGIYDLEYARNRLKIGSIHKQIGVEPKLYLASMAYLTKTIKATLRQHIADIDHYILVCGVLDDVLSFDTTLVFETYIGDLVGELETKHKHIEVYAEKLEKKINLDPLTGLYNQPAMLAILNRELAGLSRQKSKLSLIYFDIDNFKTINDNHGHQYGDEVIKSTGRILTQLTREMDTPCRYGGDEFCVVLPDCDETNAKVVGKKFISKFEQEYPNYSVSIGIQSTSLPVLASDFINKADKKMYEAKRLNGSAISC